MTRIRGTMMWVPGIIIEEMEDIKREDNLETNSKALHKMTQYVRVGREAKRIFELDFRKAKTLRVLPPPTSNAWKTYKINPASIPNLKADKPNMDYFRKRRLI